ncbi:reverse transcriptase ribonuclease h [Moniliophthora roreri MCA 2997]|uniref:Reverse transcriptase ribonuclease h n=1 Tax=Moniliophthora roreri (strain MCA 2997) TaxID=1381753 RepID=V2WM76_MONRO|nr:reverse transcriptase ribonuclease h [Moniliophthora roreri MCA 2997]
MTGANQMVGRSQSGSSSADALRGLQGINLSSGSGISTPPGSQPESSSQDPSARPTAGSQRPSLLQHQWQQAQQQGDTSQQQSPQQPPPPQQPAAQQQDSQNQEAQEHPRLAQQPASRSREGQSQPKLYTEAEFQELLAMLHPSAVRQPSNPMFVSPSSVEEARHQAQAIEEEKKKKVPELVDGFRANLIKSSRGNHWVLQDLAAGDMSYPRNDPDLTSVNAGISADDFPTEWGTFNKTAKLILSLPPGCMAATFDILVAYHLTPIRPDQQWALCIYWNNYVHVDHAVMFGLTSSASVFGAVADMLIAIYQASGYRAILKWVDDFLVIHFPDNTWSEEEFMDLTEKFGVP